ELPTRCRTLAGMTIRPRATSSRMNSGATHSRCATRRISAVIRPVRAAWSCVIALPSAGVIRFRFEGAAGASCFLSRLAPDGSPSVVSWHRRYPAGTGRQGSLSRLRFVVGRGKLLEVSVAHLAAGHAPCATSGVEHVVHPAAEGPVVAEDGLRS